VSTLTSFSISAWVNLTAAPTHVHIFDFGTGPTTYVFLTPHSGGSMLQLAITTGGSTAEQVINAPLLATGVWQHLAFTLTNTTGVLYLNGAQVGQNPAMTLNAASLGNTTQNWLGRSQFTADPYLNGQIDEFRIYNRALSASEVQQLFLQR
jgi:Concanavalin A-like lectin/glucanases superfamily